jgi:MFS family permease
VLIFASTIVLERLAQLGRNELSALHFAGVGTGIAVSAALVAGLLELGQGWQSLWLASGALSFVALLAAAALLPTLPSPAMQTAGTASAVADARLRRLIVAYGLFGFGYHHCHVPRRDRASDAGDPGAGAGHLDCLRNRRRAVGGVLDSARESFRDPGSVCDGLHR